MDGTVTFGRALLLAALVAAVAGCGIVRTSGPVRPQAPFTFATDTLAFANESHRILVDDPASGTRVWADRDPRPSFALHCQGMVRVARQFRVHARFDPAAPRLDDGRYLDLVRAVLARDPRATAPAAPPVVIPGFADLREFSAAYETMLKDELRRDWRSVVARGDWRIVVPVLPAWQEDTAMRLQDEVRRGATPIVRVFRFPQVTVNHALLLFAADENGGAITFQAYDPNDPSEPLAFRFDLGARTFVFPPRIYFPGGPVKLYEIYGGLLS